MNTTFHKSSSSASHFVFFVSCSFSSWNNIGVETIHFVQDRSRRIRLCSPNDLNTLFCAVCDISPHLKSHKLNNPTQTQERYVHNNSKPTRRRGMEKISELFIFLVTQGFSLSAWPVDTESLFSFFVARRCGAGSLCRDYFLLIIILSWEHNTFFHYERNEKSALYTYLLCVQRNTWN